MVTLCKNPLVGSFGILAGDFRLHAGIPGCSYIKATDIGKAIKKALSNFHIVNPEIRLLQYALMPDHIHLLIFVERPTEEILGRIIARFKVAVNEEAGIERVFDKGFNDQILHPSRSLDVLYRYLRDNPRRLAVRRVHPDFFRRVNALSINGNSCQAYGNTQLLDNPFMEQVVVHRADSQASRMRNRELWLHTAANGGVLVSPFISPAEKAIRHEAEALGGRTILITNEHMPERYKPAAHDFSLCEQGRLLIISPEGLESALTRTACMRMNSLAKEIADKAQKC